MSTACTAIRSQNQNGNETKRNYIVLWQANLTNNGLLEKHGFQMHTRPGTAVGAGSKVHHTLLISSCEYNTSRIIPNSALGYAGGSRIVTSRPVKDDRRIKNLLLPRPHNIGTTDTRNPYLAQASKLKADSINRRGERGQQYGSCPHRCRRLETGTTHRHRTTLGALQRPLKVHGMMQTKPHTFALMLCPEVSGRSLSTVTKIGARLI
jgi:hypothetical protein